MKYKKNKIKTIRNTVEIMKQTFIGNTFELFSILELLKASDLIIEGIDFIYENDLIISMNTPIYGEYETYELSYEIRVQTENDIITNIYYYYL